MVFKKVPKLCTSDFLSFMSQKKKTFLFQQEIETNLCKFPSQIGLGPPKWAIIKN
jgi:hypothetical protein